MALLDRALMTFADEAETREAPALLVAARGYAGPLRDLLALVRSGRLDLRSISLAEVAGQVGRPLPPRPLEATAEALALVAELAWRKSILLLPPPPMVEEAKTPRDPAVLLARRVAMQEAARRLEARPRLGADVFVRGAASTPERPGRGRPQIDVLALVRAYAELRMRGVHRAPLQARRVLALTVARALATLGARMEELDGWRDWAILLEPVRAEAAKRRADPGSAASAAFAAALELARRGELELRQARAFGPIEVRRRA